MRVQCCLLLTVVVFGTVVAKAQNSGLVVDCEKHLERANSYESSNDSRAEQEFRLAISTREKRCSDAFLDFSYHLSSNLRFSESADALEEYVKLTPREDHSFHSNLIKILRNAATIKTRVDNTTVPQLQDLIDIARLLNSFGRQKPREALPYAEKAVALYPTSLDAIMLLAGLLTAKDNDRVELLLNQAIAVDPNVANVRSTLGYFYLFMRGRKEDAKIQFEKALELSDGKDPLAWKGRGYLFKFEGQRKEALAAFRKYQSLLKGSDGEVSLAIEQLETEP